MAQTVKSKLNLLTYYYKYSKNEERVYLACEANTNAWYPCDNDVYNKANAQAEAQRQVDTSPPPCIEE